MKHLRLLFYLCLYLLSLAVAFGLVYFITLYITASRELAAGLIILAGVLIAPFLFVGLYWAHRCEYRPHSAEESEALWRASALMAVSSLPCVFGVIAWREGWLSVGVVALAIYGALTAYDVRLLWRLYRTKHDRLVAEGLLGGERHRLSREQRSNLLVAIVIGLVVNVFAWTGIYFIYHGAIFLGTSVAGVGALLCHPMIRKLRQAVVLE